MFCFSKSLLAPHSANPASAGKLRRSRLACFKVIAHKPGVLSYISLLFRKTQVKLTAGVTLSKPHVQVSWKLWDSVNFTEMAIIW